MAEDVENHCFWLATSGKGVVRMEVKGNVCHVTLQPDATLSPGIYVQRGKKFIVR